MSKLIGKGKKIKLEGIEIEIKPLSLSDMNVMTKLGNEETRVEATKELITKVLKEAMPSATDEEIENVDLKHINKIMETILELNQFGQVDKEFIKKLKEKQ